MDHGPEPCTSCRLFRPGPLGTIAVFSPNRTALHEKMVGRLLSEKQAVSQGIDVPFDVQHRVYDTDVVCTDLQGVS